MSDFRYILDIVKPVMAVQRILSCEHLMPLRFTEKSLKEDLMEILGNITSHLSNGLTFRNNYDIYALVLNLHALCRIIHSCTSSMYRLEIISISIFKSSQIIHLHSWASKFSVCISFLSYFRQREKNHLIIFSNEKKVLQFISSLETAGAKIVVLQDITQRQQIFGLHVTS